MTQVMLPFFQHFRFFAGATRAGWRAGGLGRFELPDTARRGLSSVFSHRSVQDCLL